ncbi:RING finger protein 10 isoform X2 [Sabethes cyaneus]|uniref:RING finger protein 10 isoform X2 n=1 Tax=Sabethes cyaneus TaxID=53552 RepID=UPI00237E1401|nr:RING finger protein 10 isoform X2 [Sabethes cyaneus]
MEKSHRFSNQNLSKGPITDPKKNPDASTKWPRHSKRREQTASSGYKPENNRNSGGKLSTTGKTRNQTNFNYDKRSRQRPDLSADSGAFHENETSEQFEEQHQGTGLAVTYQRSASAPMKHELYSLFAPGSKKQSLNHLLNFHCSPRDRDGPMRFSKTGNNRSYIKKPTYNKEQFLQANCQFVVRAGSDYTAYMASPDHLVEWDKIEQIHIFSYEESQCPICLYPPVAAKMTKCGHVYCWPCILHYLALSDKTWRKCPICYDAIHLPDLRSAVSKPFHSFTVGETVTFQLMRREKMSLSATSMAKISEEPGTGVPQFRSSAENTTLTKLLLADSNEILNIISRERLELENQIVVDGIDCPENIFVQQSLQELIKREEAVLNGKFITIPVELQPVNASQQQTCEKDSDELLDARAVCILEEENQAESKRQDFMIDEESNFLLSDIDIVPTAKCASSNCFYFYQAIDGQPLYLHSLNTRMLQTMYGSLDKSPLKITGRIVHKDSCSMSEDLRKRLRYLQHLPVCTSFEVVEIEFEKEVISNEVLAQFKEEINARRKKRQKIARAERVREKQIYEYNERQLGKSLARSAKIPIDSIKHFPSCGSVQPYDFSQEPTLSEISPSNDMSPSSSQASSGPSWSTMLCTSPSSTFWPSLSAGTAGGSSVNAFAPLAAPAPKLIPVTGSKMMSNTPARYRSSSEKNNEDETAQEHENRASCFGEDLSIAIGVALEKATLNCEIVAAEEGCTGKAKGSAAHGGGNGGGGAKKKKNKKTLLFASGMNLY